MDITLRPEQEQFIQERLTSGKYHTAEEVVTEAFRLLEEREGDADLQRIEALRGKITSATEQIARGQVTDGEVVFEQLWEKIRI